jgi:Ran GTPase-activating protein (RanGAP) involved in mRNA processing and transport
MKISSKVSLVAAEAYLHHLDLSNNTLNYIACKLLASMIKSTVNLQLLNLSNCGLRNTSAKEIANALLFN